MRLAVDAVMVLFVKDLFRTDGDRDNSSRQIADRNTYFRSIFNTTKIKTAPPRPPPNTRYSSDQPAAANRVGIMNAIISEDQTRIGWTCGQAVSAAGVVSHIIGEYQHRFCPLDEVCTR